MVLLPHFSGRSRSLLVLLEFGSDHELDLVADRRRPDHFVKTEIAALERGLGGEAQLVIVLAERALHAAVEGGVQSHRLGDSGEREIARDVAGRVAGAHDGGRLEGELGKFGAGEDVGAAQFARDLVAQSGGGLGIDGDVEAAFRRVERVEGKCARRTGEESVMGAEPEMHDREEDLSMVAHDGVTPLGREAGIGGDTGLGERGRGCETKGEEKTGKADDGTTHATLPMGFRSPPMTAGCCHKVRSWRINKWVTITFQPIWGKPWQHRHCNQMKIWAS